MNIEQSGAAATVSRGEPADPWIEIVAPVESASAVIAQALQNLPIPLAGVSVAVSERGTILLNQCAWTVLYPILKALDGLQTRLSSEPLGWGEIKFCVLT
jgi:hypothetical protein